GLRQADVDAALRRQNANDVDDIERLTIEPGGAIVATLKPEREAATAADVARLEAKLDALLAGRGPTTR
ncbi:MAG TPA: YetF domain-containing protein, partial [Marmoricola sp.]